MRVASHVEEGAVVGQLGLWGYSGGPEALGSHQLAWAIELIEASHARISPLKVDANSVLAHLASAKTKSTTTKHRDCQ